MIPENKALKLIKKCKTAYQYKSRSLYLWGLFIAFLFSTVIALMIENDFQFPFVLFFLLTFAFWLVAFLINLSSKILTIHFLLMYIQDLMFFPMPSDDQYDHLFINRALRSFHPLFKNHSAVMYVLGRILIFKNQAKAGLDLINLAIEKDANLNTFDLKSRLKEKDAGYLITSLQNDQKLKRAWNIYRIWNNKLVRYSLVISCIIVIALNILVQTIKIFTK